MKEERKHDWRKLSLIFLGSASALALSHSANAQEVTDGEELRQETVTVQGIRGSLAEATDIKRNAQGVVDAITNEDMGKFPDTNLAESLQRITGVSINRSNGEGSQVTVRGFGPDFNLVLLNGRQMPTAYLEGGAPSSRSFDFGNIASEGIASVEVYKTGLASIPTGGIGSTLNIKTARPLDAPGLRYSAGAKGVYDDSVTSLGDKEVTPEISGIYSNTFANDTFGVALAGSYQERNSGYAQVGTTSGWRGAYLGAENNWGTLPQPPGDTQVTNRPGPDDIYSTPQNVNYSLTDVDRERLNGQATLQYSPGSNFTATLDYFYTQNKVATERADMSVWFNHGDVTSGWTDGPIASPLFYNEDFGDAGTDLSMGGAKYATKSENQSLGLNFDWQATDRLGLVFDVHSSSAESGQDSPYGTSSVISAADFQLRSQAVDFTNDMPVLGLVFQDPFTGIDPSRMISTGSVFSNSYIKTEIDQAQLSGHYDFDTSIVDSVDFGVSATKNKVRSAFANAQRDTWGGVGTADDLPDDIFRRVNIAENFDQFSGSGMTQQDIFVFDFDQMVGIIDSDGDPFNNACGGDGICRSDDFLEDRRIEEESYSAFFQVNNEFDIGVMPAKFIAGLRYETTDVTSPAQVTTPSGVQWVAANEFGLIGLDDSNNLVVQEFTGEYDYWLPAVDFRIDPRDDVVLRASYSKTMTRPGYGDIAGGLSVQQIARVDGGTGTNGNTNLKPFISENFDLSGEWYYDEGGSYLSAGYFRKNVENFIGSGVVTQSPFEVYTPYGGERYNAALAAVGDDAVAIRQWIFENADPSTFEITGTDTNGNFTGNIFGVAGEDPLLTFDIATPVNQETATVDGWEFAVQHFFGETGFGVIANYTIVDGDVAFDDTQVPSSGDPQFAITGLSDSYNLIGFYDKNGLQARLAYNWRDKFLTSTVGVSGTPNNPQYVEDYGQLDFNVSYEVRDGWTLFVEGINVTDETTRTVGRTSAYVNFATQTGARYNFGFRFNY